jgi:hypothetical protein
VAAWEERPDVEARRHVLEIAHEKWRADRRLAPGQWPGIRYVLLHTFAHAAIREFALECGYSAAGIAERIYARSGEKPMAGLPRLPVRIGNLMRARQPLPRPHPARGHGDR